MTPVLFYTVFQSSLSTSSEGCEVTQNLWNILQPRCLLYLGVCKGVFRGELSGKKESCLSCENFSLLELGFLSITE